MVDVGVRDEKGEKEGEKKGEKRVRRRVRGGGEEG